MAVQTIRLYLEPSGIADVAHASQLDTQRQFKFLIYDENGAYTFPSGSEVSINGQKPDGYLFDYTESDYVGNVHIISKSGNQVIVNTTQQMTACPGNVACQIRIAKDGQDLGVLPFTMFVQKTPLADEQGFSRTDLPSIQKLATEQMERAEAAADNAEESEQIALTKANEAATSATTAIDKATEAANSASAAAASAAEAESYTAHPPYIGANGNWYIWNITQAQYVDSGIDASITVTIADVTMLDPSENPRVTNTGTDTDPIFHLFIPRGKGIANIAKTSTSGLVDTYTITFSDGYTITYTVTNGKTAYQSAVEGGYSGTEAEFEADLAHFEEWKDDAETAADSAADSKTDAAQSALDAANSASLAEQYADFVTPHFIIENNRLYIKDDAVGEFVVANNRLYIKLAS